MKKELEQLIAQGKTEQVLRQLLVLSERQGYEDLREEVLLQYARYEEYSKGKRQGTSSTEGQQAYLARITQALLHLISQLPDELSLKPKEDILPDSFKARSKPWWQWMAGTIVIIGILAGIVGITGFDLKSLFGMIWPEKALQLTVYVHGPKSQQDIVLDDEGMLIADFGNRRDTRRIGEDGRTNFGEIGSRFLGKEIGLSLKAEGYEVSRPDTIYVYDGEPIYLEVKSSCQFCTLAGTVQSQGGRLLSGIVVMVKGTALEDTTDQNGRFLIKVPPEQEQEEYILSIVSKGRITWENYVTPSPESPIEILLSQ